MTLEVTTPRASPESSVLDSSRDNAGSTTRTLLNTSSALLNNLSPKSSQEREIIKQPKLQLQGRTHVELRTKLKTDLMAKLEVEAQRNASGLTCSSISVQQQLCMNMLSNGKPKSFLEFFNLTYSEPPEETPKDSEAKKEKGILKSLVKSTLSSQTSSKILDITIRQSFISVKFNLGKVSVKKGSCSDAITWFEEYLDYARGNEDTEGLVLGSRQLLEVGQSKAHAAIAKTQESRGETELAMKHLEALLEVSQHVNLETQAKACCKLGMMYNRQQIYDKALLYFEMFFKLACSLKDPKLMDAARLNLGFVRNTLNMSDAVFSIQQVC